MSLGTFAPFVEPAALVGAGVAIMAACWIVWHFRESQPPGLHWYLRNLRLKQICALATLFYLALAASCLILGDPWGWLYLMLAFKAATWWYRRTLVVRPLSLHR